MSPGEALALGRGRLAGVDDPGREARLLLSHAAGVSPGRLVLLDSLGEPALTRYRALLEERAGGRPMARLLGYRDFWRHRFEIGVAVLDPRADTESLVARALDLPWRRVLDLGTGSGCILISLLAERADARGVGTDISDAALELARRNAETIGVADRVGWQRADWYAGVSGQFDLIVSNPPYIAEDEMAGLAPEVLDHEPRIALTPGGDGLAAYRVIAAGAGAHLSPGGALMVEIGWQQRNAVSAIFAEAGLCEITCFPDLAGRDRVISARKG